MKDSLATFACILLGSGLGILLFDFLKGAPLQAPILSALAIGAVLLQGKKIRWSAPLTASLALSLSLLNVQVIVSVIYSITKEYNSLTIPLHLGKVGTFYEEKTLIIVVACIMILAGIMIFYLLYITLFSPLWKDLENLTTPLGKISDFKNVDLLILPLGITIAYIDKIIERIYNVTWGFILLIACTAPLSVSVAFLVNTLARITLELAFPQIMDSVKLGTQIGIVVSMAYMLLTIYLKGSSKGRSRTFIGAFPSVLGVFLLLLGITILITPFYAVIALTLIAVVALVTSGLVTELEGGFYLYTRIPKAYALTLLSWLTLALKTLLNPGIEQNVMTVFMNPVLHQLLGIIVLWSLRTSSSGNEAASSLLLSLLVSTTLVIAREALTPGAYTLADYLNTNWAKNLAQLPEVRQLVIDPTIVLLVAGVVATMCTAIYYYFSSPKSKWRFALFVVNPPGLLAAYSMPDVSLAPLAMLVFLTLLRIVGISANSKLFKRVVRGALALYGLALILLAFLNL